MDTPEALAQRLLEQRTWLRQLALHLSRAGEADDLAQATYVAALEHPRADVQEVRSWLAAIARNLARGLRRSGGRRDQRERGAARGEALPSTAELVERVDTERALAQELLALREPYRTTLMLRFHEGLSAEEIARRQDVAAGTVRWRTSQGLAELRAKLEAAFGGRDAFSVALVGLLGSPAGVALAPVALSGAKLATLSAAGVLLLGGAYWSARSALEGEPPATLSAALGSPPQASAALAATPTSAPEALTPSTNGNAGREPMTASLTRLRVLESDGTPNAGRRAALWTSDQTGEPQCATIDADGWVAFPASGETLELAVERVGALPYRSTLELVEGERTLALPAGAELSGWVEVEGHAPAEPLELTLLPAGAERFGADDVRELFVPCTRVTTQADGAFRLQGLAPQAYDLGVPRGFALLGKRAYSDPQDELVLPLDGPTSGLRLELERHVTVRGRILAADGVTPVSEVSVMVMAIQANGNSRGNSVDTRDDGRFVGFLAAFPSQVVVEYQRDGGLGAARAERTLAEPALEIDFGDLRLDAGRSFTVRVQDAGGAPLAGALTSAAGPTDAQGEVRVEGLGGSQDELWVGAAGYVPRRIELGASVPDPLVVTLEAANELAVLVRDAGGQALADIGVEVRGPRDLFSALPRDHRIAGLMYGSSRVSQSSGEEGFALKLKTDDDGRLTLRALRPGVEFDLRVMDSNQTLVHEQTVVAPAAAEHRGVELRVTQSLRPFSGRVVDAGGVGQAEVSVVLVPLEPQAAPRFASNLSFGEGKSTQRDGRFSLPRVRPGLYRLTLKKEGSADLVREPYELPDGEAEFVLEPGRTCVVRVEDPSGQAVGGGELSRSVPGGGRVSVDPSGLGLFELRDLGGEAVEIELRLGGILQRETVAGGEIEHVVSVPSMGAIEARWTVAPGVDVTHASLRLLATGPGRMPLDESLRGEREGRRSFQPVPAGAYQLELLRWEPTGEPGFFNGVTLLGPVDVTVTAGETAAVALGP